MRVLAEVAHDLRDELIGPDRVVAEGVCGMREYARVQLVEDILLLFLR